MANASAALAQPPRRRGRRRRVSLSSDDDDNNDGQSPSSNEGPSSHIVSLISDDDDEPPLKTRSNSVELPPEKPSPEEANGIAKKRRPSRPKKVQKITGYASLTSSHHSNRKSRRRKRHRSQEEVNSHEADDGDNDNGGTTSQPVQKRRSRNPRRARSQDEYVSEGPKLDGDKTEVPIIDISSDDDDFEVEKNPPKPTAARIVRFRVSQDIWDESLEHTAPHSSQQPIAERLRDFEANSVVVSRQKRKQIRGWLEDALSSSGKTPKFLVLHGPSGCGKWTALRALFRELGVEPLQWNPPIPSEGTSVLGSLLESLEAFLCGTNYPSLLPLSNTNSRRVCVLRDLPISLADSPFRRGQLQEILAGYIQRSNSVPAVCLFSDNAKGVARLMRLIGPGFVQNVATIRVYAPSLTATRRALSLVVRNEGIKTSQKHIEELAEAANGDLRLALNALHLHGKQSGKKKKRRSSISDTDGDADNDDGIASIAAKDGTLGTYHAVSKVLNNKKTETGASKYDVERILDDAQADPIAFMGFLHQNYTEFFGDYEDAMHALEALSEADCLMKWQADNLNRNCLTDCAASIATRAFLLHNDNPVRKGWRPIRGPESFIVANNARVYRAELQQRMNNTGGPQVVTRSTILEQVAYAEKIGRFQIAPWHSQNRFGNGYHQVEDADIAMVDAERTADKMEPLPINVSASSDSGNGASPVKKEEVMENEGEKETLEEEIEGWDSDVG